jgi:hypothetical protein
MLNDEFGNDGGPVDGQVTEIYLPLGIVQGPGCGKWATPVTGIGSGGGIPFF